MPIAINSPARNLFLLGSSGGQVVTNFFEAIDQAASGDENFLPDDVKYYDTDETFVLAGTYNDGIPTKGFLERRDSSGTASFENRISPTTVGSIPSLTLRAMDVRGDMIYAVGKTSNIPWVAKYDIDGLQQWQSTTNTGDIEYTGVAIDDTGNVYACGNTPTSGEAQAFVEKFDANGNPGWGKSAFMLGRDVILEKIAVNNRGEVVAVGIIQDDEAYKGYIVKIDANTGEVLWDRTLRSYESDVTYGYTPVFCEDVHVDSNDQIFIVGRLFDDTASRSFVIKYSAEGNIVWQSETEPDSNGYSMEFYEVNSDDQTEQVTVFGRYTKTSAFKEYGVLSKYSKSGDLVWRRTLSSTALSGVRFGETGGRGICLDADPSFYYLLFTDKTPSISGSGNTDRYVYGKVSSSGNGLGDFQYTDGTGETIDYEILNVGDQIGRLSDGSVRNDTSDLLTYPFNANKLLFDDLATHVSNKRRQMDSADSFEYIGSPAIRVADFQGLNLLGDVYSGSGNWLDQSGKGNDGVVNGATHNAAGYWEFDGTDDYITTSFPNDAIASGDANSVYTLEAWIYVRTSSGTTTSADAIMGHTTTRGVGFQVGVSGGSPRINYGARGTSNFYGPTFNYNEWRHIVLTRDGTNGPIAYENGVEVSRTGNSGNLDIEPGYTPGDFNLGYAGPRINGYFDGFIGEARVYPRALTPAQVFQNYNATKSKYINEAPDTAPKIGPGIVYDSNLLLNYDFGNRATYDRTENLLKYSEQVDGLNYTNPDWGRNGSIDFEYPTDILSPLGTSGVSKFTRTGGGTVYVAQDSFATLEAGKQYTFSTYIKKGTSGKFGLELGDGGDNIRTNFNINSLTHSLFASSGDFTSIDDSGYTDLGNGWYRIWITGTVSASPSGGIFAGDGLVNVAIYFNADNVGEYGYVWGAQVNEGGIGRYIKTTTFPITAPTTVKNLSNNLYTATMGVIGNAPTFDSDGYFDFTAANDEIIALDGTATDPFPKPTGPTVEAWAWKSNWNDGAEGRIVSCTQGGGYQIGVGEGLMGSANVGSIMYVNGGYAVTQYDRSNLSSGWHHFVGTFNGTTLRFYVDGTEVDTDSSRSGNITYPNTTDFLIGGEPGGAGFPDTAKDLTGRVAEVRVYDRVLTASEVSQNFNATKSKYGL